MSVEGHGCLEGASRFVDEEGGSRLRGGSASAGAGAGAGAGHGVVAWMVHGFVFNGGFALGLCLLVTGSGSCVMG